MTYDRTRDAPLYVLRFEAYPGLEVRVGRPSFLGEKALTRAWPVLCDGRAGQDAQRAALEMAATAMAQVLVDWSLVWAGREVPASRAGLLGLDTPFLLDLVWAWVDAATQPAEPVAEDPAAALIHLPVEVLDPDTAELAGVG